MNANQPVNLKATAGRFVCHGTIVDVTPYGSGHINDTYAVRCNQGGALVRYILQRINHHVFTQPDALMDNIRRVTEHQHEKLLASGAPDASRRALTLIPTRQGDPFYHDEAGHFWRMYIFIEHATGHDRIENTGLAEAAARAFGEFQHTLADLSGPPLHETIPGFHNTPARLEALIHAVETDPHNRAKTMADAIDFALARETDARKLLDLQRQGRITAIATHNDTKLNNVLIDDETGEGICVIDLDTVMPGLALYDFGDMVRTATNSAREDEPDTTAVHMRMPIFEALARGYLGSARSFLGEDERELLPFSGKLLAYECGVRFLTDYLKGDPYFKTHRPGQNADRCRCQFALARSIEVNHDAMQAVVERIVTG